MKTRKQLAALLGATLLLFALFGVATATHPATSDAGVAPTVTTDKNITTDGNGNSDAAACDEDDAGSVNVADLDTDGNASFTTENGVTVNVSYDAATKEVSFTTEDGVVLIAYVKGGNDYATYNYTGMGGVTEDGNLYAPHNSSGGPAGLSHVVFCTGPGAEATPTFEATEEGETDDPTATPEFSDEQEGETDTPTEPNTATIGGNGTSGPADGAWLLVVALGVLLASVVVMTPARAKSRR